MQIFVTMSRNNFYFVGVIREIYENIL